MSARNRNRNDAAEVEAAEATAVKVGDTIELAGNGLAVLPDGTVVTCRNTYTVQHVGRHVIGGAAYDAAEPAPVTAAADPAETED